MAFPNGILAVASVHRIQTARSKSLPIKTRKIQLERRTSAYWRVTLNHPPLNIFGPDMIPELERVIQSLEVDADVKVIVFDSAVEGFFLTHYDFLANLEDSTSLPPGPTGLQALPDLLVRLSRAFIASLQRPGTQARIQLLMKQGFHKPGDAENRLGHYVGQLGNSIPG